MTGANVGQEPLALLHLSGAIVIVLAENIPEEIWRNADKLTVLGWIKIQVHTGRMNRTVVGTVIQLCYLILLSDFLFFFLIRITANRYYRSDWHKNSACDFYGNVLFDIECALFCKILR